LAWNKRNPGESWAPQSPTDLYRRDGKYVKMTAQDYSRFTALAGRRVRDRLRGRISEAQIRNPSPRDVEMVRKAFEAARADARAELFAR